MLIDLFFELQCIELVVAIVGYGSDRPANLLARLCQPPDQLAANGYDPIEESIEFIFVEQARGRADQSD